MLLRALESDTMNAHARFGMGLILFRGALDAASSGARVVTVTPLLNEGGRNLEAAISRSKVLARRLDEGVRIEEFKLIGSGSVEGLSPKALKSLVRYACAWRAYVEGDYRKQLAYMRRLEVPKELEPYAKLLEYSAHLHLGAENAEESLASLDRIRRERPDDGVFGITYGMHACRHGRPMHVVRESFSLAARDVDSIIRQSARIWWNVCRVQRGERAPALREIEEIVTAMERSRAERSGDERRERELRTADVDLGYFFALAGEYRRATRSFSSIARYPDLVARVRTDSRLSAWRADPTYQAFLDEVERKGGAPATGFVCEREVGQ